MPLHRPKKKAMPKKITLKIKETIAIFSGRFDDTVIFYTDLYSEQKIHKHSIHIYLCLFFTNYKLRNITIIVILV